MDRMKSTYYPLAGVSLYFAYTYCQPENHSRAAWSLTLILQANLVDIVHYCLWAFFKMKFQNSPLNFWLRMFNCI